MGYLLTSWVTLIGFGLLVTRLGTALPRGLRVAIPIVVAIAGFLALNVVNLCGGFCDMYGFPAPYHYVSDAAVVINGVQMEEVESPLIAGLINAGTLGLVTWLVWKSASKLASAKPAVR